MASFALVANTVFIEAFNAARLGLVLGGVLLLHMLRFPRVVFRREAVLYAIFLAYMLVELMWTSDRILALNTIVPAINFVVILVLYSSLAEFHDRGAILGGTLFGFMIGVATYTFITDFPFVYPADFSYNAIASMYLFGLFVSLLLASRGRWTVLYIGIASVALMHIMATTSIKTNLGILCGAVAAAAIHFRFLADALRKNLVIVLILIGTLIFAIASIEGVIETLRRGVDRVGLGIELLQARENMAGYSAFERRSAWLQDGFAGWVDNPLFGHGVEAFRAKYGTTSHASFIDLLYNSGLIGFLLFFGVLVSVMWRLYRAGESVRQSDRAVILAIVVCYVFIALSGNIHYKSFLAVFVAVSTAILNQRCGREAASAAAVTA